MVPQAKVSIADADAADSLFRVLMGDKVEPRREFIERHALEVKNLVVLGQKLHFFRQIESSNHTFRVERDKKLFLSASLKLC